MNCILCSNFNHDPDIGCIRIFAEYVDKPGKLIPLPVFGSLFPPGCATIDQICTFCKVSRGQAHHDECPFRVCGNCRQFARFCTCSFLSFIFYFSQNGKAIKGIIYQDEATNNFIISIPELNYYNRQEIDHEPQKH